MLIQAWNVSDPFHIAFQGLISYLLPCTFEIQPPSTSPYLLWMTLLRRKSYSFVYFQSHFPTTAFLSFTSLMIPQASSFVWANNWPSNQMTHFLTITTSSKEIYLNLLQSSLDNPWDRKLWYKVNKVAGKCYFDLGETSIVGKNCLFQQTTIQLNLPPLDPK